MRAKAFLLTSLAILVFAFRGFAQVPTTDEIQSLVSQGNYKDALQKISTALAIRGEAGKNIDRAQLQMLKAECHLRMKAPTMAAEAYAAAVKDARDDKTRNLAAAHQLLMQRQRGLAYRPVAAQVKGSAPVTIDILDPASRKKAFAALLTDELAAVQPKIAAAKRSTGLAPIFEAFKLVPRLEGIELASTESQSGEAPQAQKVVGELADQSRKLIDAALKEMARHVSTIDKEVNQFVEIAREVPDPSVRSAYGGIRYKIERGYKKKGPTESHLKELQQVTTTCEQIAQASKMLADGVPANAKAFDPLISESERIRKETERILDADYTTIYKDLPTRPKP
jgi:hypothetical protein